MSRRSRLAAGLLLAALSALAAPPAAVARDYASMYPAAELERVGKVYSPNIEGTLFQDIARYLGPDELATLRRVRLFQPWTLTEDPFVFSANPETGAILVPTFSVKFLDDLAVATAWFERFGCNKEAVFDYVAALDFSDLDLPSPLPALGVPHEAYKLDPFVDDVSQKILKSAIAFILLHELGHVHHRHESYDQVDARQAQAQEAEADRFALGVLRRMRLPPLGMAVWFMAASMRDPLVEGSPRQTHPLTSTRLQAIAEQLRTRPEDFIEPANRGVIAPDVIRSLAGDFDGIGSRLAERDLRSFLRERGRLLTPALLRGACRPQEHEREWMRRFGERGG